MEGVISGSGFGWDLALPAIARAVPAIVRHTYSRTLFFQDFIVWVVCLGLFITSIAYIFARIFLVFGVSFGSRYRNTLKWFKHAPNGADTPREFGADTPPTIKHEVQTKQ